MTHLFNVSRQWLINLTSVTWIISHMKNVTHSVNASHVPLSHNDVRCGSRGRVNESCRTYEVVRSYVWINHVWIMGRVDESCRKYDVVRSHVWHTLHVTTSRIYNTRSRTLHRHNYMWPHESCRTLDRHNYMWLKGTWLTRSRTLHRHNYMWPDHTCDYDMTTSYLRHDSFTRSSNAHLKCLDELRVTSK